MSTSNFLDSLLPPPTIRNKLVALFFLLLLVLIGMVFALVYAQQRELLRTQWTGSMTAQARLIARNIEAAIAFEDRREASRLLESLSAIPAVELCRVLAADGKTLAEYRRPGASPEIIPDGTDSPRFLPGHLLVREPILLPIRNEPSGHIELLASLDDYYAAMHRTLLETALLLLLGLSCALLLTRYVVGRLIKPLEQLDDLTRQVSTSASPHCVATKSAVWGKASTGCSIRCSSATRNWRATGNRWKPWSPSVPPRCRRRSPKPSGRTGPNRTSWPA